MIPDHLLKPGLVAAAIFEVDDNWYRVTIAKIVDDSFVMVTLMLLPFECYCSIIVFYLPYFLTNLIN